MIEITFLGTSSGVPTKTRNLPSIHIVVNQKETLLFDCGEGTQRQMFFKGLSIMKIDRIFITHWHADHFAGLIGLIQTLSLEGRTKPLYIYGVKESKRFVDSILNLGYFFRTFEIVVEEMGDNQVVKFDDYSVRAFKTEHRVPSIGFVLETNDFFKVDVDKARKIGMVKSPLFKDLKKGKEVVFEGKKIKPSDVLKKIRGKKIVYTGDTRCFDNLSKISKDADVLIMDSTFGEEHKNKAELTTHSTSVEASKIARKAKVKKLILTHFSRRYENKKDFEEDFLLKEAKKIFDNTIMAEDFLHINAK